MLEPDLTQAALLLLGHGTTRNAESSRPVYEQAARLRQRNLFSEVREAFWKQEPSIQRVLDQLEGSLVFIVPLFMSEGYFCGRKIPMELGFGLRSAEGGGVRMLQRKRQTLVYSRAVGTSGRITDLVLNSAQLAIDKLSGVEPPAGQDISLFIAGHGTEKADNSRHEVERQVGRLQERGLFASVQGVFLEERPGIGECYELARTQNIVVVPFFLSEGLHVQEDIPVLLGESPSVVRTRMAQGRPGWTNGSQRFGRRVWIGSSLGRTPGMGEIILERVREAAAVSNLKRAR